MGRGPSERIRYRDEVDSFRPKRVLLCLLDERKSCLPSRPDIAMKLRVRDRGEPHHLPERGGKGEPVRLLLSQPLMSGMPGMEGGVGQPLPDIVEQRPNPNLQARGEASRLLQNHQSVGEGVPLPMMRIGSRRDRPQPSELRTFPRKHSFPLQQKKLRNGTIFAKCVQDGLHAQIWGF